MSKIAFAAQLEKNTLSQNVVERWFYENRDYKSCISRNFSSISSCAKCFECSS